MPLTCCVVGCSTRSNKDNVSLFRIPKITDTKGRESELKKRRQQAWLKAIGRSDLHGTKLKNARVCSRHFLKGVPSDEIYESHPDWAPSKYLMPEKAKSSPSEARKKRNKRLHERSRRINASTSNNATQETSNHSEICIKEEPLHLKEKPLETDSLDSRLYQQILDSVKDEFVISEHCNERNSKSEKKIYSVSIKEEPVVNVKQECSASSDNKVSGHPDIIKTIQSPIFEFVSVKEEHVEEDLLL